MPILHPPPGGPGGPHLPPFATGLTVTIGSETYNVGASTTVDLGTVNCAQVQCTNLVANGSVGIGIHASGGQFAGQFDGTLQVNGDHYTTGTLYVNNDIVLPASDCAEDFDVAISEESDPGTVMVLNDNGSLEPSQRPYDKRVAGVISGAGEYRPGLILGRSNSSAPRAAVALVGKVYCKVDAGYEPIAIGDLLTTSATVGHAMKVTDDRAAFGAVIGKALQRLSSGRGLVPILVALQ